MRWKTVALVGALGPAAVGCNMYKNAARTLINEHHVVYTQIGIECELRKEARAAWYEMHCEYPRKAFTEEFRDGFLDGYVDYLDRGGNGSVLAVAPSHYTRHKKYYTEEGHCLLQNYLLGFKYGQEIAIATGKRKFLTVPVLLPQEPKGPPAFTVRPHADPAPTLPDPKPVPKSDSDGTKTSKFGPPPAAPEPDRVPAPIPPLAVADINPPPVVEIPVVATPAVKLPPPPPEVPSLPDHVPTPSVLDELPVIPPNHTEVPVVPPSRIEP